MACRLYNYKNQKLLKL